MRTRRRSLIIATLLGLAFPTSLLAPALADAEATDADSQLMIVLDSSGSMLEETADGNTRADAATAALLDVVDALGNSAQVGLRQFGATATGMDNPESCTDSQLTVPLGTDNRDALRAAARAYEPYGETPLGHALSEAGGDLGESGQRSILVISDGEANCEPDPCEVAQDLAAQDIETQIHAIGFQVTGEARDALLCIADAGGGQYYDASDTDSLTAALQRVTFRAMRSFEVSGEEIEGTPDTSVAPTLTAGTRYLTPIPAEGDVRHFRIEREIPGSQLWASLSSERESIGIPASIEFLGGAAGDWERCGNDLSTSSNVSSSLQVHTAIASSDPEPECSTTDSLILKLENFFGAEGAEGLLSELTIIEEPPVANLAVLPGAVEEPEAWVDVASADATQILGGVSLAENPEVTTGTYAFDLLPGESALFHSMLDWGQSLQVRTSLNDYSDLTLFSPTGDSVTGHSIDVNGVDTSSQDPRIEGYRTAPVNYRNRESNATGVKELALPGAYTFAIARNECIGSCSEPGPITVTMDVLVDGEVAEGPGYLLPEGVETSEALAPEDPENPEAGDGDGVSDGDAAAAEEQGDVSSSGTTGGGSGSAVLPVALGVVGAGVLLAGIWALLRRRPTA
ncbi:vWA domain-containing protein [Serinibacter salmoneus]|uniref:Ca-activated chloride channel family protein n=1 Tax=Serinibacter salmoneus TaxID=556530 RepID=A0A2A9D4U1_9MICO|nr:VWA domain-containing protein [Serinibacter salmoneus]PFG20972.1 Ca-activated chloride channel family protein [Serinibacter salmoneus]